MAQSLKVVQILVDFKNGSFRIKGGQDQDLNPLDYLCDNNGENNNVEMNNILKDALQKIAEAFNRDTSITLLEPPATRSE